MDSLPHEDHEFELKLVFPANKLAAIEKFLIAKGALKRQHLQAAYIDTPDFRLARAGIALRLRKEGRQWVQTLKTGTSSSFDRLEHEIVIPHRGAGIPIWSLAAHAEHPAGVILMKALLNTSAEALAVRYSTDIWRRKVHLKARNGLVEYALDLGQIKALDSQGKEKTVSVMELEIELLQGKRSAVLAHTLTMIKRFGAYLDTRGKAQQGFTLVNGIQSSPPVRAELTHFSDVKPSDAEIISAIVQSCLAQILPNLSEINSGINSYDEHLHQLRVGLRRFKSALKILALNHTYMTESQIQTLDQVFQLLGTYRDNNFISEKLSPALKASQGPAIQSEIMPVQVHPRTFLHAKPFQELLLAMIALGNQEIQPTSKIGSASIPLPLIPMQLKKRAMTMLDSVYRDTKKQAANFKLIDDAKRHRLRKKLKFLRYSLEFFGDFCQPNKRNKYFKIMTKALESLGNYNDICVALHELGPSVEKHTQHWFALGWLSAEQNRIREQCYENLKLLYSAKKIW